ncbi:hypothetical protein LCGC14_2304700 [marine sediment metagenome]|uniref:Uncharacterized protein n=1 Tax=marine sediment metagenome TaxID=412755 RepID=A0A0F9D9W3_9ZZZZ|nr:hypothetical protein [bacterium]
MTVKDKEWERLKQEEEELRKVREIRVIKKQIVSNVFAKENHKQAIAGLEDKMIGLVCELKDLEKS